MRRRRASSNRQRLLTTSLQRVQRLERVHPSQHLQQQHRHQQQQPTSSLSSCSSNGMVWQLLVSRKAAQEVWGPQMQQAALQQLATR
jgi:hypothetical protein